MSTLVLGAGGFLGLNIVDALVAAGETPRCGRRVRSNVIPLRSRKLPMVVTDLEQPETLREAMIEIWDGKTYVPAGYKAPTRPAGDDPSIAEVSRKIAGLSQQQARILSLICKGKPNKLIAYEMQLAEATVKAHITALLRRLGVQNRTQAALLVREVSIRHHLQ